jgi:hypothetical protein
MCGAEAGEEFDLRLARRALGRLAPRHDEVGRALRESAKSPPRDPRSGSRTGQRPIARRARSRLQKL